MQPAPSTPTLVGSDPAIFRYPVSSPYTTPALRANLVLRVSLSLLANLSCVVPMRMLYRNSELAGVVFVVVVELKNVETVVDSLLWPTNDTSSWWPGYGLCDLDGYFQHFALGLYVTCMLAIMRNLAQQVGLLRVSPMTGTEKRRRNLIQALVMFPLPIVQVALTYPLAAQRYAVGTLAGCLYVAYPTWLYVVFFAFAPVLVCLATAAYAVLTYIRFRQVAATTQPALSSNRVANRRAQRTRRRLYLMILSILIPFTALTLATSVMNVIRVQPLRPYSYSGAHDHTYPYGWNVVTYYIADQIHFSVLNDCYIPILSAVPIFLFFGMTKDAINEYRKVLLFLGLGGLFPALRREYDPDRAGLQDNSLGSSNLVSVNRSITGKSSSVASSQPLTNTSTSFVAGTGHSSLSFATSAAILESGHGPGPNLQEPGQGLLARLLRPAAQQVSFVNPFPMRTRFNFLGPLRRALLPAKQQTPLDDNPHHRLQTLRRASLSQYRNDDHEPQIKTHVWSHDDDSTSRQTPEVPHRARAVLVETALMTESHQTGDH